MKSELPKYWLQRINAAQAQILMAFVFLPQAMTAYELAEATGLQQKRVESELAALLEMGPVQKHEFPGSRETWLPADSFPPAGGIE